MSHALPYQLTSDPARLCRLTSPEVGPRQLNLARLRAKVAGCETRHRQEQPRGNALVRSSKKLRDVADRLLVFELCDGSDYRACVAWREKRGHEFGEFRDGLVPARSH
jgi:hypothetical protein